MMRFELYITRHTFKWVCLVLIMAVGRNSSAEDYASLFSANKKTILSQSVSLIENVVFSKGTDDTNTDDDQLRHEKASNIADLNFINLHMSKIKWPDSISPAIKKEIFSEYLRIQKIATTVKHAVEVYSEDDLSLIHI